MPMVILDRLPVPSLRVYTAISIGILSCSVYYAAQIVKDPSWRTNHTNIIDHDNATNVTQIDPRSFGVHLKEIFACMIQEPGCIWVKRTFYSIFINWFIIIINIIIILFSPFLFLFFLFIFCYLYCFIYIFLSFFFYFYFLSFFFYLYFFIFIVLFLFSLI